MFFLKSNDQNRYQNNAITANRIDNVDIDTNDDDIIDDTDDTDDLIAFYLTQVTSYCCQLLTNTSSIHTVVQSNG